MCKWGTNEIIDLMMPAHLSHTGEAYLKETKIDACIAPIIRSLNDGGVATYYSCCRHGDDPGRIDLVDGRGLFVIDPARMKGIDGKPLTLDDAMVAIGELLAPLYRGRIT